jgi:hypothetical protein
MTDFGDFDSSIYERLPEDPEEAFLVLEWRFRREADDRIRNAEKGDDTRVYQVDYIAQVLATIDALNLESKFGTTIPSIENVDYATYTNFSKEVKHYRTILEIRRGRRVQGYSVQFDTATKVRVQHHLEQLRGIFDSLEVEQDKRESLLDKLNKLQQEVDRERTRFDIYAALVVEAAGVVGDAIEKSKVLDLLNAIGRVMWNTKDAQAKRLPVPTAPKRIEPPRPSKPAPKKGDLDDEIPF